MAVAASVLVSGQAWALGLGRLSVQSALGESLRAEIDVTQIAPEEASTLQTRVAAPDVYRAAGIDYNAALTGTKVALQRRADGRTVLVLSSDRAVVEPFLDVILELNWSSGRLVRAYTLLLDPPTLRPAPPVQATAPTAPAVSAAPPAPPTASPVRPQAPAPARAAAPAPMASPSGGSAAGTEQVRVASGDTLSRIASRVRPAGVSLDQMLVALFRANPDAFMGENMNRLKAGVVLDVPSGSEADSVSSGEARQIIVAQSADFDAYRRRLAGNVERTDEGAPTRQASGSVQAQVEDRSRPAATPPDKLTLAQAGSAASASETAVVSKQTEAREAAARVAELARNVEELKKLQGSSAAAASAGTAVATAPAAAPKPAPLPSAASAAVAMPMPASAPAEAAAPPPPPMAASTPAPAPKPAPKPAPAPAAEPEGGMLSSLLDNPLVLPLAGVLVLLLAGLGLYRLRGRMRKSGGSETSFLESRLQPDSFFGASGGQRIDTREAPSSTSSSSMSYSLSQLDAIGDVDPVAEADVYLAYGRDLQAEEILKEAMRATPDRQAIRLKLLEVYAKRRDTKAFELLATQLFSMTNGDGEDWVKAQELGRGIDPDNTLYQPGGQPDALMMQGGEIVEPLGASTMPHTQKPTSSLPPEVANLSADLDLDLDVDLEAPTQPVEPSVPRNEMTQPIPSDVQMGDDSSLDLPTDSKHGPLDFELPVGDLSEPPADPTVATPPPPPSDFGALDFELDVPPAEEPAAAPQDDRFPDFKASVPPDDTVPPSDFGNLTDDPLARKLELAEEFRQIGDLEGARDLLEEVISKSDGTVKAKAQGMLDRLA